MEILLPPNLVAGDLPPDLVASLLRNHDDGWHEARRKGIGGSDAVKIMAGDWLPLWEEKTGRREPEDLSGVLPVVMGTWTEPLNRYWFERVSGMAVDLSDTGSQTHPEHPFMRANLDGRVGLGIWEGKHVNPFAKPEDVREKYYPQVQHNMAVTGAPVCYLSVFLGTMKFEWFEIDEDPAYQAELIGRELAFWEHVRTDSPPAGVAAAALSALPIDQMREEDMTGSNAWAAAAADWSANKAAAKAFEAAAKDLKGLVAPDVKRAFGNGVEITRAKNGAMTIKESK